MATHVEILTVDASNVGQYGFFCYKSKPKAEGYRRKLAWLERRFAEGMTIKIVREDKRSVGFLEYIPGQYAWRAVQAPDYLMIHCLWVVGRAKKKGYGSLLLRECLRDAREMRMQGVAMVTSQGNWLASSSLLLRNGFEVVDRAPPKFELVVKRFVEAPAPALSYDWERRLRLCGSGLTVFRSDQCPYLESAVRVALDVFRSDQCPYLESAVRVALEAAGEAGVDARVVHLKSAQDVQALSPSSYGVFGLVYNGRLLSYHLMGKKELLKRLGQSLV
jgi:ribosomal protein S18 acetylase RimI-like enzyme